MTGKTPQRGYLGIIANTVAIPEEIAEQAGLEQDTGVMIFSVEADSPARKAGLAMGDVLVKFNGKPVTDFYGPTTTPRRRRRRQRNQTNHHPQRNTPRSNRNPNHVMEAKKTDKQNAG